jgi:hypothetical protein
MVPIGQIVSLGFFFARRGRRLQLVLLLVLLVALFQVCLQPAKRSTRAGVRHLSGARDLVISRLSFVRAALRYSLALGRVVALAELFQRS